MTEILNNQNTVGTITYTPHDLGWVRCTDRINSQFEHTIKTFELIMAKHREARVEMDWNTGRFYFTYFDQKQGKFGKTTKVTGGFNLADSVLIWEKELGLC